MVVPLLILTPIVLAMVRALHFKETMILSFILFSAGNTITGFLKHPNVGEMLQGERHTVSISNTKIVLWIRVDRKKSDIVKTDDNLKVVLCE